MLKPFITLLLLAASAMGACAEKLADIYIRDPFILTDSLTGTYYLYRAASKFTPDKREIGGVEVFTSKDLQNWSGPREVLRLPENNALLGPIWAPEVHRYNGRYYIFATITSPEEWKAREEGRPGYFYRGTQIFHSDSPTGPFLPFSQFPHTPMDQMALDGTLWIENGNPYMVYCHEWVELNDGTMELLPLTPDLSAPAGAPTRLFNASAAKWSTGPGRYVTDGCFLHRTPTGKLLMIWSSFNEGRYAIGIAESVSGSVRGPWRQQPDMLFPDHGGHGMIFRDLKGNLNLILHQPNSPAGQERARIFPLEDTGSTLRLK